MSNSKSSNNSGCFSAVFRRLLCSGSPQTHPSDQITESNEFVENGPKPKAQVAPQGSENGPGIVARLMGLDSLPEKSRTPGPVTRSRSVNFVDYMLEFDLTQAKHRRVKTSASFREVLPPPPPQGFNRNQNHEFLFVYLDNNVDGNYNEAEFIKTRKYEKGNGSTSKQSKQKENVKEQKVACKKEINQEKNKKISKLKNEPRRVSGGKQSLKTSKAKSSLKMVNQKKEVSVLTRKKKNQHEVKKVEFKHDSEGSSPVSVLSSVSENILGSLELKAEKKCSSKSVNSNSHTMEFSKKSFGSTDIMELVGKPFKLTKEDIKFSNWIIKPKEVLTFEDFEEICSEFGEQILDFMLQQVADELTAFHMQN
ncbi:hypothetical protein CCACVL1_10462 [Corchorus capsularis]|uniref:DUF3741 domain-containing protein n=1 Tax=Corchorus capsularis TaxID=210143 RepID=A0A1R3IR34_COCAP|nr:hypothetical protein CCACVL1_10462 [Corchorus capsularis]